MPFDYLATVTKMIDMLGRKQGIEDEVIDPVLAARRNRDVMRLTVAIVGLAIIVMLTAFCISLPSPLPLYLP